MPVDPVIHFRTAREICATWGPTIIRICDGVRTDVDDLIRVEKLFDDLLEDWPAIGMLVVFTHETPLPTTTTQRYLMNSMSRYEEKLVISVALLGLGFWSATFRAGVSAVIRVVRSGVAVEGTVEAAIQRLTMDLVGVDPERLHRVFDQLWANLEGERLAAS